MHPSKFWETQEAFLTGSECPSDSESIYFSAKSSPQPQRPPLPDHGDNPAPFHIEASSARRSLTQFSREILLSLRKSPLVPKNFVSVDESVDKPREKKINGVSIILRSTRDTPGRAGSRQDGSFNKNYHRSNQSLNSLTTANSNEKHPGYSSRSNFGYSRETITGCGSTGFRRVPTSSASLINKHDAESHQTLVGSSSEIGKKSSSLRKLDASAIITPRQNQSISNADLNERVGIQKPTSDENSSQDENNIPQATTTTTTTSTTIASTQLNSQDHQTRSTHKSATANRREQETRHPPSKNRKGPGGKKQGKENNHHQPNTYEHSDGDYVLVDTFSNKIIQNDGKIDFEKNPERARVYSRHIEDAQRLGVRVRHEQKYEEGYVRVEASGAKYTAEHVPIALGQSCAIEANTDENYAKVKEEVSSNSFYQDYFSQHKNNPRAHISLHTALNALQGSQQSSPILDNEMSDGSGTPTQTNISEIKLSQVFTRFPSSIANEMNAKENDFFPLAQSSTSIQKQSEETTSTSSPSAIQKIAHKYNISTNHTPAPQQTASNSKILPAVTSAIPPLSPFAPPLNRSTKCQSKLNTRVTNRVGEDDLVSAAAAVWIDVADSLTRGPTEEAQINSQPAVSLKKHDEFLLFRNNTNKKHNEEDKNPLSKYFNSGCSSNSIPAFILNQKNCQLKDSSPRSHSKRSLSPEAPEEGEVVEKTVNDISLQVQCDTSDPHSLRVHSNSNEIAANSPLKNYLENNPITCDRLKNQVPLEIQDEDETRGLHDQTQSTSHELSQNNLNFLRQIRETMPVYPIRPPYRFYHTLGAAEFSVPYAVFNETILGEWPESRKVVESYYREPTSHGLREYVLKLQMEMPEMVAPFVCTLLRHGLRIRPVKGLVPCVISLLVHCNIPASLILNILYQLDMMAIEATSPDALLILASLIVMLHINKQVCMEEVKCMISKHRMKNSTSSMSLMGSIINVYNSQMNNQELFIFMDEMEVFNIGGTKSLQELVQVLEPYLPLELISDYINGRS